MIMLRWFTVTVLLLAALPAMGESLPTFFGRSGQFIELTPKRPAPDVRFLDETGARRHLAEFRGKAIVLNIWATWCPPCVYEMPALARLAEAYRDAPLEVVAISIDRDGLRAVKPFFRRHGLEGLRIYLDPNQESIFTTTDDRRDDALPLYGLPVTFFIDQRGILVGYLTGAAEWDAEDVRRFLTHLQDAGDPVPSSR